MCIRLTEIQTYISFQLVYGYFSFEFHSSETYNTLMGRSDFSQIIVIIVTFNVENDGRGGTAGWKVVYLFVA